MSDILTTLQCFKPFHLGHLAITERLPLTKLAVQPSYAANDTFVFGAKAIVINHLKNWLSLTYNAPDEKYSVLTNMNGSHVPPLPVHSISQVEFDHLSKLIPVATETTYNLNLAVYAIDKPFEWRGISILPIEMERNSFLFMSRVMRSDLYTKEFGVPECLTMSPIDIQFNDGSKWCVMDESFHFVVEGKDRSQTYAV